MKFTITRTELLTALSITGKAVVENIIPACGMYQFTIVADILTISSCNMREQITVQRDCKADFSGSYLFPAKELTALIKSIPEQPVNFEIFKHITPATETQPEQLSYSTTIFYNKGKASLPIESGEAFPVIKCEQDQEVTISADDLNEGIFRTLYACSNDELRPVFTGVLVELTKAQLRFTGCDTNVLSTYIFDYECQTETKIIVPKNTLRLIADFAPTGDVFFGLSKSAIIVKFNGIEIKCLLIDEKVIDFKQIIPTDNSIVMSCNREELLSSLNRSVIFVNKFNNVISISVNTTQLTIKGEDINFQRDNIEDVVCECNGEILIGTNINWLISSLQRITTEQVYISFKSHNKAMVITEYAPVGDKENLILVMPLWVN